MQTRPAMMPLSQYPRPNASTSSGVTPRSSRYGCEASRVRAKPRGLLTSAFAAAAAAVPDARRGPLEAPGDALVVVDGPSFCFGSGRPVLGLPSASASACPTEIDA